MATAVAITVPMQLSKETKGSFRYDAVEEDAPCGMSMSASRLSTAPARRTRSA